MVTPTTVTLTGSFGAAVGGLDLASELPQATVDKLLRMLDTHGVLVLRDQRLTPLQFARFARSLGSLATRGHAHAPPDAHELSIHSNILENGIPCGYTDVARQWRMDGAHLAQPYRATVVYAVEVPHAGGPSLGDTWFANTSAAYAELEPALRQTLTGMRAAQLGGPSRRLRAVPYYADAGLTQIFKRGTEHPVVRTHPRGRYKCLYVNPASTARICGMHERDSEALLQTLYQHMARPEFAYRHQWRVGDVLLWDNCATQYRTEDDYAPPLRRLDYRVYLKDG